MKELIKKASPLFVDLDGTFINTDTLYESFLNAFKEKPFVIFECIIWLFHGRSTLKYHLAKRTDFSRLSLPLNLEFYSFLVKEKDKREIILATASDKKIAEGICKQFNLFDSFICSDKNLNLKGEVKLNNIKKLCPKFSYAGNSVDDFVILDEAIERYLVNPSEKVRKISRNKNVTQYFDLKKDGSMNLWLQQIRIHHWIKNFLIFVPLLVSGKFLTLDNVLLSLLGFLCFNFLASSTYIINDLFDLEADRNSLNKKDRPLASCKISIPDALIISLFLASLSLIMAIQINYIFTIILLLYLLLTVTYSLRIKQLIGIDVIVLASLYTLRIIAGAAIIGVTVSFWLLSFSMFIFFSLALLKRCSELKLFQQENENNLTGRDYNTMDYTLLMNFGISSAMLGILMFCFYINHNVLNNQYQEPNILWLNVPLLSYWLMRLWIKTNRGEIKEDPIVYSIRNKGSIMTIFLLGVISMLAQLL